MYYEELKDRQQIENFLRKDAFQNIYSIADLDDKIFPLTKWYVAKEKDNIKALGLLFLGTSIPVLILSGNDDISLKGLFFNISKILPKNFYCHINEKINFTNFKSYESIDFGTYCIMGLKDYSFLKKIDVYNVIKLTSKQIESLERLYQISYPNNWFDKESAIDMPYFGVFYQDKVISAAGLHAYSNQYSVAVIGNIVTHIDHRGKGYCKQVTTKLIKHLQENNINTIGLSVNHKNVIAIECYKKIGFSLLSTYQQLRINRKYN